VSNLRENEADQRLRQLTKEGRQSAVTVASCKSIGRIIESGTNVLQDQIALQKEMARIGAGFVAMKEERVFLQARSPRDEKAFCRTPEEGQ